MPKRSRPLTSAVLLSSLVLLSRAYGQAPTQHPPSGTATYLSHADLMAVERKSADRAANDTQVAVVDVNRGEYHVAVGIAHRSKESVNSSSGGGIQHSDITEVYYIISGEAILNTGGAITDLKDLPSAPGGGPSGPTSMGGAIIGGISRAVGPGDVIVIPPNTPHRFSRIDSAEIVYVLMRPDPHKVLPVMNLLAK